MSGRSGWDLLREKNEGQLPQPEAQPPAPLEQQEVQAPEVQQQQEQQQPAPASGWALLRNRVQREEESFAALVENTAGVDSNRRAAVLNLSRVLKRPSDWVEDNLDEYQDAARLAGFDLPRFRKDFPELVKELAKRPEEAPVVVTQESSLRAFVRNFNKALTYQAQVEGGVDFSGGTAAEVQAAVFRNAEMIETGQVAAPALPKFEAPRMVEARVDTSADGKTGLARLGALARAPFGHAAKQVEYSDLGYQLLMALRDGDTDAAYELEKRVVDMERDMHSYTYGQDGLFEQVVVDAAELAPAQLAVLAAGGTGGAVGAAAGATVGMLARSPQAARVLAWEGYKLGGATGATLKSFQLEAGGAYLSFRLMRTDDGKPVPEAIAAGAAIIYGSVAATLESNALPAFLGMFGRVGDMAAGKARNEALQQALLEGMKNKRFRTMVLDAGKRWLAATTSEAREEVLQDSAEKLSGWYATSRTAGEAAGDTFQAQDIPLEDWTADGLEVGLKTFRGTGAMGAPRLAAAVVSETFRAAGDKVAAWRGKAIVEAAKEGGPLVQGAPDSVAEVIRRKAAETGEEGTHLYVDPAAVQEFFQANGADFTQGATELFGPEGPRLMQEAIRDGGNVEVPVPFVLKEWAGKPAAEALALHVSTRPGGLTTAQEEAKEAQLQAQSQAFLEAAKKGELAYESDVEKHMVEGQVLQLVQAGHTEKDARAAVGPLQAFLRTKALRMGKPADVLFNQWRLRVERAKAKAPAKAEAPAAPSVEQLQGIGEETQAGGVAEARALVARMTSPAKKAMAQAWVAYCQGEVEDRPKVTPELEKELARYGVVDPAGFHYHEDGRSMEAGLGGRRVKGVEPEEFRRLREYNLEHNLRNPGRLEQEPNDGPRNLLVQHNLQAKGLLHLDELGGIPAPSLAVSRKEHPLENFGEVTLLGPNTLVDPAQGTPVFDADVYSPRWPETGFKVDTEALQALVESLTPYVAQAELAGGSLGDLESLLSKQPAEDVAEARKLRPVLQLAYLAEKGVTVEVPKRKEDVLSDTPTMLDFFATHGVQPLGKGSEYHRALTEAILKAAKEYDATQEYSREKHSYLSMFVDDDGLMTPGKAQTFLNDADPSKLKETDRHNYGVALEGASQDAGARTGEYLHEWALAKLKPLQGEKVIAKQMPSGRVRQLPYTLESILYEMTHTVRQGETKRGMGATRAAGAKQFASLKGVKAARDSIVPTEKLDKLRDEMELRYSELRSAMAPYHEDERYEALEKALADFYKSDSKKNKAGMQQALERAGFSDDLPAKLVKDATSLALDLVALPTEYFEAKPQRVVRLEEFKAAVVPDSVDPKVLEVLQRRGLRVVKYERGNDASRRNAIAEAAVDSELLFQSAYQGTPHRGIERFSLKHIGSGEGAQVYGWGMYFAQNKQVAEWYRETLTDRHSAPDETLRFAKDAPYKDVRKLALTALREAMEAAEQNEGNKAQLTAITQRVKKATSLQGVADALNVDGDVEASIARFADNGLDEGHLTDIADMLENRRDKTPANVGQVYRAEVPEDDVLLDYDAPLDRQPTKVLAALEKAGVLKGEARKRQLDEAMEAMRQEAKAARQGEPTPEEQKAFAARYMPLLEERNQLPENWEVSLPNGEKVLRNNLTGRILYKALAEAKGSDKEASLALLAAGIPGLRYLDGNSRNKGKGNHNFVVWDEGAMPIAETYYQRLEAMQQDETDATKETPRGSVRFSLAALKRYALITLNPHADLSTYLHEMGHVFLEMNQELAMREDAPEEIRKDWAATLKWLGLARWEDRTTEHHEKWARGFEAYLFEGKAPSAALARTFHRFSIWLRKVYSSTESLRVNLSPEIRDVFDRMFATDAEIDRQRRAAGLEPLWRSPEEAGMEPQAWQAYLASQARAAAHVSRQTEMRVLKDKLDESKDWWKDELKKTLEATRAEYDAQPAAQAMRYLRHGEFQVEDGPVQTVPEAGRLEKAAVERVLGKEEARRLFGRRLQKEDAQVPGESPDDVALQFGFPTGEAMLRALQTLQPREEWAKAEADKRMREAHPDILEEQSQLAALVQNGLHAEATSDWLLREWKQLRSRAGRNGDDAPIEAIERAAHAMAEGRQVRNLDAGRTLAAERAAAERAAVFAAKGDYLSAYVAKQQQLLNHFLYRELTKAREERDAWEKLTVQLRKQTSRAKLGKAHPFLRDAVDGLLEALGAKMPEDREKRLADVKDARDVIAASGTTLGFDVDAMRDIERHPRHWKSLTVRELREVVAALHNMQAAARNMTTVLVDGKRVDKEEVKSQLRREIEANLQHLGAAVERNVRTWKQRFGHSASAMDGERLKQETMVGWMGGNNLKSMWHRAIIAPLQKAKHLEADLLKKVVQPLVVALERMPKAVRERLTERIDSAALFPSHRTDYQAPVMRHELLAMALNWGNDGNRERLLQGRGLQRMEVEKALELLTKEEWDWVQSVWDAAESLWPLASELEERDSGLMPLKVKSAPVSTRFGRYRGGYYPVVYSALVEAKGEKQAAQTVADLMDASYTRPGVAHGHLKGRVDGAAGAILLDLSIVQSHLAQVVHDIAYREAVKSVGGLLMDDEVAKLMKEHLGQGRQATFLTWLKDVGSMRGSEIASHVRETNALLKHLSGNMTKAVLGYSIPTFLGDFANIAVAATVLKKKHWAAGLAEVYRGWKLDDPTNNEAFDFIRSKSAEMRFRDESILSTFNASMKRLTDGGLLLNSAPVAAYRDGAFVFMEASDKLTSMPIWLGAYRQALAEGKEDADAVEFADSIIRKLFPSGSAVDKAEVLRTKGFMAAFRAMYGYLSVSYNIQRDIVHGLHTAEDGKEVLRRLPMVLVRLLAFWTTSGVVSELLTGRGPEDDDGENEPERWRNWYVRKLLLAPLATEPVFPVAAVVEGLVLGKKPSIRGAPALSMVEPFARAAARAYKGKVDGRLAKDTVQASGLALGLPTRPTPQLVYLYQLLTGGKRFKPNRNLSGLVYGEREDQPRNILTPTGK